MTCFQHETKNKSRKEKEKIPVIQGKKGHGRSEFIERIKCMYNYRKNLCLYRPSAKMAAIVIYIVGQVV